MSRSGKIRSTIGPAIKYLRDRMEIAKTLLDIKDKKEDTLTMIRQEQVRLTTTLTRLDTLHNEWQAYIDTLEDEALEAENAIYDNFKMDDLHFAEYIEEGKQILGDIQIELAEHSDHSHDGSSRSSVFVENNNDNNPANANNRENQHNNNDNEEALETPRQNQTMRTAIQNAPHISPINRPIAPPRFISTPKHGFGHGFGDDFGTEDYLPIKLPPFQIPKFDGDPLNFSAFWQAFEASVDSMRIPRVHKLTYLLSHLDKKVLPMVSGYAVTNDNYDLVVKALKEKYADSKALRESLQSELIHLASPNDEVQSLDNFVQSFERICRQLKNMNCLNTKDGFLLNIIKSKLPKKVIEHVVKAERSYDPKLWDLNTLRKILADYVSLQMEIDRCVKLRQNKGEPNKSDEKKNKEPHDKARTFGTITESKKRQIPPCVFCKENHWSTECPKFTTKEERIKILINDKRCFRCLRSDHISSNCKSGKNCRICNGMHHQCICGKKFNKNSNENKGGKNKGAKVNATIAAPENEDNVEDESESEKAITQMTAVKHSPQNNLLMSVDMIIFSPHSPEAKVKALGAFDSMSQVPFLRMDLIKKLNLPKIGEKSLDVHVSLSKMAIKVKTPLYLLNIQLNDGNVEELIVYGQNWIHTPIQCCDIKSGKLHMSDRKPDLMICIGEFWRFFRDIKEISPYFYKIYTSVGPILCGRKPNLPNFQGNGTLAALTATVKSVPPPIDEEVIRKFWDLENVGIYDEPKENEDEIAEKLFSASIQQINGRYRVGWPWKDLHPELPSNFDMAFSRLKGLYSKLKDNPELLKKVNDIIMDQLNDSIIEDTTRNPGSLEHFLPFHAVITHKIRLVYAANAHPRGKKSLNECLYRGKDYLPDLAGMLLRFRMPAVAMWADIQAAFLQIELHEEDRNVVKFIWVRDIAQPINQNNLRILRFQRVPFGVISSPFLLMATLRHHLEQFGTNLALNIKDNIYMDNAFMACKNENEAIENYMESKKIFASGKMNLREFISNSQIVNDSIPMEDKLQKDPKILGLPWDIKNDKIILKFPQIKMANEVTRRIVLEELASNFDPLGVKIPCLLNAKLFFQKTWDVNTTWDEPLPLEMRKEWREITAEWEENSFEMPRRILPSNPNSIQLHAMVDASKNAYCVAIYLIVESENGVDSNLIFAKNRLKPHKKDISIPRMELLAIVLGLRVQKFVKEQLLINMDDKLFKNEFLWTDNQATLAWINSNEHHPKFVLNRINEIRKYENVDFGFVRSEENPADLGTKGISIDDWKKAELWWKGPKWLVLTPEEWPSEMRLKVEPKDGENELIAFAIPKIEEIDEKLIDINKFSSFGKLVKTIGFCFKFIHQCRRKNQKSYEMEVNLPSLNEIELAENWLIKLNQINIPEIMKKMKNINMEKDENGIWRLITRIQKSEAEYDLSHPIILDKHSKFVELLVMDIHQKLLHLGPNCTLNKFLGKFWMPQARRTVRNIVRKCLLCSRINSPPFALPIMPQLPPDRGNSALPFSSIGIDYLGPTFCKEKGKTTKCWLIIISCLITRAIYLVPVLDLSTLTLIHILRRFSARRGSPKRILSDNGSSFRALSKLFDKNSCSFLWCGCGLVPGSSCLFYRPYAQPISNFTYELIRCQNWRFRVETNIKFWNNGKIEGEEELTLFQGMTTNWNKFSLSLIGGLQAPSTLFNRYFLSNENSAALTDEIQSDLFCPDKKAADSFKNCTLLRSACSECYPEHDNAKVECICRNSNLENIMEDPEKQLDLSTPFYNFRFKERKIIAETHSTSILIMLSFDGLKTILRKESATCSLNPISLKGCYNCLNGGELTYTCKSDFGNQIAEIKCGELIFTAFCHEKESIQNITLGFSNAEIGMNCTVNCGKNSTFFWLEGHLYLLANNGEEWNRISENMTKKASKWNIPKFLSGFELPTDWTEIYGFLLSNSPFFILFLLGFLIILAIFIYFNPIFRTYRLLSRNLLILYIFYGFLLSLSADGCQAEATFEPNRGLFIYRYPMYFDESFPSLAFIFIFDEKIGDGPSWQSKNGRAFVSSALRANFSFHSAAFNRLPIKSSFLAKPASFFHFGRFFGILIGQLFAVDYFSYSPLFSEQYYKLANILIPFFKFLLSKIMPIRVNALKIAAEISGLPLDDVPERLLSSSQLRAKLLEILLERPVWTNHMGDRNRRVTGTRITALGANLLSAFRESYRRVTVAHYYTQKWETLKYPSGPCLSVPGGNGHVAYYPLEVVDVEFPSFFIFFAEMRAKKMAGENNARINIERDSSPNVRPNPPTGNGTAFVGRFVGRRIATGEEAARIAANTNLRPTIQRNPSNPRGNCLLCQSDHPPRGFQRENSSPNRANSRPNIRGPSPPPRRQNIFSRITFILPIILLLGKSVYCVENKVFDMEMNNEMGGMPLPANSTGNATTTTPGINIGGMPSGENQGQPPSTQQMVGGGNFANFADLINNPPPPPPNNVSNASGLLAPLPQYGAMAGLPQMSASAFHALGYDPQYPGLKGETLAQLQHRFRQQQLQQPPKNDFDQISDDDRHQHKRKRRNYSSDESSDERQKPKSFKKGYKGGSHIRRQSTSPSGKRGQSSNFQNFANALTKATAANRELTTMLRQTNNSSLAILTNGLAESLATLKSKLLRDGHL